MFQSVAGNINERKSVYIVKTNYFLTEDKSFQYTINIKDRGNHLQEQMILVSKSFYVNRYLHDLCDMQGHINTSN